MTNGIFLFLVCGADWFLKQYTPTRAGPELVYTDQIEKPKLGGCVGFAQGIYAIVTG